jgi:Cys-tRNA(Pro)/Cys-tRNA(Cys) deacylase
VIEPHNLGLAESATKPSVSEVDMLGPLDIHHYLLAHDVHHEIVRLPRPAASAACLAEVLGLAPRRCLAVHPFHAATADGDVLVLVLAPADVRPDLPSLIRQLGEVLRDQLGPNAALAPAGADLVSGRTDYLAGHLAPLLLPPEVLVVATQGVVELAATIVYTATGDGGTALGIGAADVLNLSHAIVLPSWPRARHRMRIDLDRDGAPIPSRTLPTPVITTRAVTATTG